MAKCIHIPISTHGKCLDCKKQVHDSKHLGLKANKDEEDGRNGEPVGTGDLTD